MKTVLINNFLEDSSRRELPLHVKPIEEYDIILRDLGFTSWGDKEEEPIQGWSGDFIYYYNNPEGMILTISGSLWSGNYKLVKITIPE